MYRILTASKDAYITNKITNNLRAKDANVGDAGTLDLFKLYDENTLSGVSGLTEYSRLLIKFPVSEIALMDSNKDIDISSDRFKCFIKLHDVYGGQTTPSNFKLILMPLSQSFDEGIGRDIALFSDLDAVNFITASISNGSAILWNEEGASASGSLNDENIDTIVSGTINGTLTNLSREQLFTAGKEDFYVDVTQIVSGTVAGLIPDHGYLISFSGSYEKNDKTYFVKRFASRNSLITGKRPKMIIKYDDHVSDNHQDFIFNVTSSLFLQNYHRDNLANILSGSSATELQGENCLVLKVESGSFKKLYSASQAKIGRHSIVGVYSSSFAIDSFNQILYREANITGSITFNEVWTNANETVTFLSSSFTVSRENRRIANTKNQNNVLVTVLNLNEEYRQGEKIKIRVFAEDRDRDIVFRKLPIEKKSEIFQNMWFRVRDAFDGTIIIPFDTATNSTKLSTDNDGMFFSFYTDSLPPGKVYSFDFLIRRNNADTVIKDAASKFKIVI